MFRLTLIAVLLALSSATKVNQCKNGQMPFAVRIKGCDASPCNVVKGTSAEMEIDFTATNDASQLTSKVKATVFGGLTISYPLPEDIANVCKNLLNGQKCPLDADEDATYNFKFPVGSDYPEIGVTLEIYLEDQNKDVVTCFKVDIKVKK